MEKTVRFLVSLERALEFPNKGALEFPDLRRIRHRMIYALCLSLIPYN